MDTEQYIERAQRTYVDVVVRVSATGEDTPERVILRNGRVFEITRVLERRRVHGGMRFHVHIGSHSTSIWRDDKGYNGSRWYVVMKADRERAVAAGKAARQRTLAAPAN